MLARQARRMLDEAGLLRLEIFASGGLDEYEIAELLRQGAPIDGFGVGTGMGVSRDAPALDMAYKLADYAGKGRLKTSNRSCRGACRSSACSSTGAPCVT
jgi:nicotinate phosphoribosyltransferase